MVLSLLDALELLDELDPRREPNDAPDGRGRLKSEVRGRFRLNKLLLFSVVDEIARVVDGVVALVSLSEVKSPVEEEASEIEEECGSLTVDEEEGKFSEVARVDSVTVLALVSSLTSFLVVSLTTSDSPSGSLGFRFRFLKSGRPLGRPFMLRPVDGNGRRIEGRAGGAVVVVVVVVVVVLLVVVLTGLLLKRALRVGPNRLGVGVVVVTDASVLVTDASFESDTVDADADVDGDESPLVVSLSSSLSATRVRPKVLDPGLLLGRVLCGALTRGRVGLGVVVVVVVVVLTVGDGRLRVNTLSRARSRDEENRFLLEP